MREINRNMYRHNELRQGSWPTTCVHLNYREAITSNHVEIWTSLLDHPNIDPNLTDHNGRTALHVANWFNKVSEVLPSARYVSIRAWNTVQFNFFSVNKLLPHCLLASLNSNTNVKVI